MPEDTDRPPPEGIPPEIRQLAGQAARWARALLTLDEIVRAVDQVVQLAGIRQREAQALEGVIAAAAARRAEAEAEAIRAEETVGAVQARLTALGADLREAEGTHQGRMSTLRRQQEREWTEAQGLHQEALANLRASAEAARRALDEDLAERRRSGEAEVAILTTRISEARREAATLAQRLTPR